MLQFFVFLSLVLCSAAISTNEVNTVKTEINTLITNNADENGRFPYIATIVRLAFHDCNGGCDGCVDTANPSNKGLETILADLNTLYDQNETVGMSSIADKMTRADFYALAGITAVERGAENQRGCRRNCTPPKPTLVFKTGRKTAENCDSNPPNRTFPNSHDGNAKTVAFFASEFGFTANEVVALMGAHTLGRASGANSGFRGPWVAGTDRLDNEYYKDLRNANLSWGQHNVGNRKTGDRWQWSHNGTSGGFMMLNSDMCLLLDFPVNSDGSVTECVYSNCTEAATTSAMVKQYAEDNASFIQNFSAVFQKMIDHTTEALTVVTDDTKRNLEKLLLDLLRNVMEE